MDAAQALADLTEISAQIEAAILLDAQGSVVAASVDSARAEALAGSARELFAAAERGNPRPFANLDAGLLFIDHHQPVVVIFNALSKQGDDRL